MFLSIKYNRVTNTLKYVPTTFVIKPISKQLNILVGCNLSFTKALNTSYLEWMDNLTKIKHHQRFCYLFSIFNLTCCKFVALKENNLSLFSKLLQ